MNIIEFCPSPHLGRALSRDTSPISRTRPIFICFSAGTSLVPLFTHYLRNGPQPGIGVAQEPELRLHAGPFNYVGLISSILYANEFEMS